MLYKLWCTPLYYYLIVVVILNYMLVILNYDGIFSNFTLQEFYAMQKWAEALYSAIIVNCILDTLNIRIECVLRITRLTPSVGIRLFISEL